MSESKINNSPEFKALVKEAEKAEKLEKLFEVWRRAHTLEVVEWEKDYPDKAATWAKKRKKIPETIPHVFKSIDDEETMENAMKYSFCGDGYIGRRDLGNDFKADVYSNIDDNKTGQRKKFTRFLILKEENYIQVTEKEWRGTIKPYNTYYGDWAYSNRSVLKKKEEGKDVTTTAMATKVAEIARFIHTENKDGFDWGSQKQDACRTKTIRKFAIINTNKRGGSASADEPALEEYVKTYEAFILKEIEILANKEKGSLEFVVFGNYKGNYFKRIRDILKDKYPKCKIYNLPHPTRAPYKPTGKKMSVVEMWEKSISGEIYKK